MTGDAISGPAAGSPELQGRDEPASAVLRFGVLTAGSPLEPWQLAALAALTRTEGVVADCWLLLENPKLRAPQSPFVQEGLAAVPHASESGLPTVRIDTSGAVQSLAGVSERDLTFILSFAPIGAARALWAAARWGVWQFTFGDWARYRGESDGFWEIVDDESSAGAALVQLQSAPEAARVLKAGWVRAHAFRPSATLRALQLRCAQWPHQLCLELLDGETGCLSAPPVRAPARERPRNALGARLGFAVEAAQRALREGAAQLLRHEQWNIGLVDAPIESFVGTTPPPAPRWLPELPRHEFIADPFGIVRDGRLHILCERLDYRTGAGRIFAVDTAAPEALRPVDIGPPVHESYPYLIEEEGHLYCIPETLDANEVALYEVDRFPDRWRRIACLIPGRLSDATPFRFGGRWWIAASPPVSRGASCELHLFHADALTGPWRPHAANPVKVDVRSARPGGTPFWKDDVLYRPAQDCSSAYGRRVVINRVLRLTERVYREEPFASVEPPAAYPAGLHTLAAAGAVTLIDAKRTVFVPQQTALIVRLTLSKLFRRLTARASR